MVKFLGPSAIGGLRRGVVFVTSEDSRSLPALLKNALDIAAWPFGHNRWEGRPGAIVGVSPGRFGALAAAQALRQPASFLGIDLMPKPEAYLAVAEGDFDARGAPVGAVARSGNHAQGKKKRATPTCEAARIIGRRGRSITRRGHRSSRRRSAPHRSRASRQPTAPGPCAPASWRATSWSSATSRARRPCPCSGSSGCSAC